MYRAKTQGSKKFWFWLSVAVNVGFLAFFKYYNFFISSFAHSLSILGIKPSFWTLTVILPVGISFYTFHGLSYVIDIYKNRIKPERNFIDYSVFVSFFPLLVAGPIERATHLLPQIKKERTFEYCKAVDGLRQILWGLFKKMVIADNCAGFVNTIFNNADSYNGSTLVLGAIFFTFQIYCDFSGYSDIAIGTARLFGIDLLRNFAFPYFSRDIAEFWRRWHISLSSWFRDYLYIPLGGSKGSTWIKVRNIFIIFVVSGFWHGANWTFIIWGFLNALYIMPSVLLKTNRNNLDIVAQGKYLPTLKELLSILFTLGLTVFGWIFFRADSVRSALNYISKMIAGLFYKSGYIETINFINGQVGYLIPTIIIIFIIIEWLQREKNHGIQFVLPVKNRILYSVLRKTYYGILIFLIIIFGNYNEIPFIYFQF